MAEQEEVKTTRLTFDYFKVDKRGNVARLVHTEVVEVFGVTKTDCFFEDEEGLVLNPDLEEVIYPVIKHEKHCAKSDYHTISWSESTRPAFWFEHVENEETDEQE